MYHWDFSSVLQYRLILLDGLIGTLKLSVAGLVVAIITGVVVGVAGTMSFRPLKWLTIAFVNFFRNIPFIVQLFWFYYTLPVVAGLQASPFSAAVFAIGLYSGAYFAEIVRAGIGSVNKGQWGGARSIGLGYFEAMRHVILPQALRKVIPPLTSQTMEVIKLTTIASTISYAELLYSAKVIADQEFRPIEAYTTVAFLMITLLLLIAFAAARIERYLR
jgi:polar amino acid transport system permease protein